MTTTLDLTQVPNSEEKRNPSLEQVILEAIAEARATCELQGDSSSGCAVAWDIVEELQAEKAHQLQAKQRKNSLETYCDMHPEALECLIYDV